MALKKCKECGKEVSSKAGNCPHCGIKKPVKKKPILLYVILGFFVFPFLLVFLVEPEPGADRFSTVELNVRSGPSADHSAISILSPGEEIFVLGDSLGWLHIQSFQDTTNTGWVSERYTSDISELRGWERERRDEQRAQERRQQAEQRRQREAERAVAWRTQDNSTTAYRMIERSVKERLKSPSTAEFPGILDGRSDHVTKTGDQAYLIVSYVDSQNSFGATIRSQFIGEVKQTSNTNWELVSLEIL